MEALSEWMLSWLWEGCRPSSPARWTVTVVLRGFERELAPDEHSLNLMEPSSESLGVPGRGIESSSISYRLLGVGFWTEEVGERGVLLESISSSSSIGITQNCVVVICDLRDKDNRTNSGTHGETVHWIQFYFPRMELIPQMPRLAARHLVLLTDGFATETFPQHPPPPLPRHHPLYPPGSGSAPQLHRTKTQDGWLVTWLYLVPSPLPNSGKLFTDC